MRRLTILALFTCILTWGSLAADELEDRALAFEDWFNTYHVSPYGGVGYVYFTDPGETLIKGYSFGDSTIWTGTYLTAECFRYAVTGDPEAKANAIRTVQGLDAHLKITGISGYIARFAGPDEFPWNAFYTEHDRYVPGQGEWEGSFWINNTSRDQYTGWFMGMATAYDLIDDEPTRQLIKQDVKLVIDKIMDDWYWIVGEDGLPTDAGPQVLSLFALTWHLIAAHIIDEPYYRQVYEARFAAMSHKLERSMFSWFNKYQEYYGFNLTHENYLSLLRLETDPVRRKFYLDSYHRMIWPLVAHTHNVFFDAIYLANCGRAGQCNDYNQTLGDMRRQLADFQDPPVLDVPLEIPEWPLDPVSVYLSDLIDQLDIRELLDIEPQTLDPRPVKWRCPRSFMWQKTPYTLTCPGGDGTEVYPGIDYMIAYWIMRYYNLIEPGNPNEIYWPEDESAGDDDFADDDQPQNDDDEQAEDEPRIGTDPDDSDAGCSCS